MVLDDLGLPFPGVHIRMKGMDGAHISDQKGEFAIYTKNESETLTFSMVGFKPYTITAKRGEQLTIKLVAATEQLEEVVVTGFVNKDKESYTGSYTSVSRDQLLAAGTKNLFESLTSVVPGLTVLPNNVAGSNPNAVPEINIRGRASFEGAANIPLFIVDGVEVSTEFIFDMDMNDIESVTVLKDASATALYGAKGSAGVIVIKTKVLPGGKLRFSYSGTVRGSFPDLTEYHLLNAADKLEYERLAGLYSDTDGAARYKLEQEYARKYELVQAGANTNWLAKPLRVGMSQNHNVGMSGGDKYARYGANIRYGKDEGVMKESYRERLSGNVLLSYMTEYGLFIANTTMVSYVNSQNSPYGNFGTYAELNPYDTPYDEKGNL